MGVKKQAICWIWTTELFHPALWAISGQSEVGGGVPPWNSGSHGPSGPGLDYRGQMRAVQHSPQSTCNCLAHHHLCSSSVGSSCQGHLCLPHCCWRGYCCCYHCCCHPIPVLALRDLQVVCTPGLYIKFSFLGLSVEWMLSLTANISRLLGEDPGKMHLYFVGSFLHPSQCGNAASKMAGSLLRLLATGFYTCEIQMDLGLSWILFISSWLDGVRDCLLLTWDCPSKQHPALEHWFAYSDALSYFSSMTVLWNRITKQAGQGTI